MSDKIDRYAVFGNPIAHSLSPIIHQQFAKQTKQNIAYEKILAPLESFADTINDFHQHGGKGANVTLPFKQQAYALVQDCSSEAKISKAVNTLLWRDDHSLFGANTDGIGLIRDLTKNVGLNLLNKKILIIGAGGAVQNVLLPLLNETKVPIYIANRTLEKAIALSQHFAAYGEIIALGFNQLKKNEFDLIINATSASLHNTVPEIPEGIITPDTVCYDMVYGKALTPFLQYAVSCGANKIIDGIGMLIEQAAEAFYLWRGVMPATKPVFELLR